MKKNNKGLLIVLVFCMFSLMCSSYVWATVDVPATNKFTREYFVFDDSDYIGIGWEPYGPRWNDFEKIINEKGYKLAKKPYKIEISLTTLLVLTIVSLIVKRIYKIKS